jgi:hypothetical protein
MTIELGEDARAQAIALDSRLRGNDEVAVVPSGPRRAARSGRMARCTSPPVGEQDAYVANALKHIAWYLPQ